jgi:Type ISP C-terminal specificity domain/N-6 DNA Methylase
VTDASVNQGDTRPECAVRSPVPPEVAAAISAFGDITARKLRRIGRDDDCVPEREEQLREPIAALLTGVGRRLGQDVLLYGEVSLKSLRARPDFGVDVEGRQAGFLEIKAPGRGVPPNLRQPSLQERRQWERLKALPNLVYTDGTTWAHYTYGIQDAIGALEGDLYTAGPRLRTPDCRFMDVVQKLLFGSPKTPQSLSGLIRTVARLSKLMRDEVAEILRKEGSDPRRRPFSALARDWQGMLFPNLRLEDFPDAYSQTVTFAMLLACASGVSLEEKSIADISDQLAKFHPLMGKALLVLTNPAAEQELTVPGVLRDILAPVRWEYLKGATSAYWLMYEDFLHEYDPALQRETGSYYTPDLVARFMVEFTDQVLKQPSMGLPRGFASDEVIAVDPAMGTGTFLVEILRSAARTIADEQSEEAQPPYLREMYKRRLIGFERQAAPYAVAELRMHQTLRAYKTEIPRSSSRYLADTLDDPNARLLDYPELFEDFRHSREGANRVKLDTRVMAVITNPPWRERAGKRDPAKWITGKREKGKAADMTRPSLDDFRMEDDLAYKLANRYVYFWRWATWKAFDAHPDHPKGIVAFITPSAYLTSKAFSGMRRYLRRTADEGWIISLTPEGHRPPASTRIFPTVQHRICIAIFVRYGGPRPDTPARVRYADVHGSSTEKIAALTIDNIKPDGASWEECPEGWADPFMPMSKEWLSLPPLDDLLPWQHSGVKPNRAWVYAPDRAILEDRWNKLIATPAPEKNAMLKRSRERNINSCPSGDRVVPGASVPLFLQGACSPRIEPVAFRSFDRQFLILDRRVVDYPRSELWSVADPPQIYITTSHDQQITGGPALTLTTYVPDTHHFDNRGGQVIPLYRDIKNLRPNIAPGLTDYLSMRLGTDISPSDLLAYIAAVAAHPAYTRRFQIDLRVPGARIPLTALSALWHEATSLGRQVLQAHTYGRALHDPQSGRPPAPVRLPVGQRPVVTASVTGLPGNVTYDYGTHELRFGTGVVAPVSADVWEYCVGDMNVIRKWFDYRLERSRYAGPSSAPDVGRSPLDTIRATEWVPRFADDLIDLLNAIGVLVHLEPSQAALLDAIYKAPLIKISDLETEGILPVPALYRRKPGIDAATPLIAPEETRRLS